MCARIRATNSIGDDGVHDLRELHLGDVGSVERKQQQKPRHGDGDAGGKRKPVDQLLAEIEASGGRMLASMKPPPCLSQSMSTFSGRLSLKKIATIRTRPTTNAKLVKLCTYLAACEMSENASGPISGKSTILPKVMFSPVRPRMTKETAVSQCDKSLEGLEAQDLLSGTPCRNPDPSHDQIGHAEQRDRAEDHDRAAPMQQHLVEIVPGPPGGLDQHAGLAVGNVDAPFDARSLLQQLSFAGDARGRIGRAIRAELLRDRRAGRRDPEQAASWRGSRGECVQETS